MFAQTTLHPRLSGKPYVNVSLCSGENDSRILVARRTESVIATGHEVSVAVNSTQPAGNRQSFVQIALSYGTR